MRRVKLLPVVLTLAAVYAALLLASHLVRWLNPWQAPLPDEHQQSITLPALDAEGQTSAEIRLAWEEWGRTAPERVDRGDDADEPRVTLPVVLIHGSPGSHGDFHGLGPALGEQRRVLAPDLPGFGAASHDLPDYSSRAHARYVLAWLDELGIDRFHVVGFSLGGVVAAELERLTEGAESERVASITLLAATGVQELELLGSYRLNHMIHGIQLAGCLFLRDGFPHFGALDGALLGVPYARNFYDTDQRPVREVFETYEKPMLILHGPDDPLVPEAAAREHHRLVPQSELELVMKDHFDLFASADRGARLAITMGDFFDRVEAGAATVRSTASAERLAAAAKPFDGTSLPPAQGLSLIILMVMLALATLISEDLTTIGAGLLVADGRLDFFPAAAACFLGIYMGDLMLFGAGRWLGRPALRVAPLKWWLDEPAVESASAWFRRRGAAVIFVSRFLPGARLPTYFAAGVLRTGFWRFAGYFALAVAVWAPALVGLSAALGEVVLVRLGSLQSSLLAFVLSLIALTLLLRKLVIPALTHAGRRRLKGAWRRWTRWEFWPPWLFYPPVVLYILWLGLKHRGWTLFTAANPGIPAGGFIGESKAEILRLAEATTADETSHRVVDSIPAWRLIEADHDLAAPAAAVAAFRDEHGLDYPLVLKPDVGQRGSGVAIVRDDEGVERYFGLASRHSGGTGSRRGSRKGQGTDRDRSSRVPTIVQNYVPGVELGIFYIRRPGETEGRIFSITIKRPARVTGDGRRSIEELIVADERAVILADLYLRSLAADRHRIPEAGEVVALVEVGTHCRGAIFLDGADLATPQLRAAVDRLGRAFEGFFFGRFDLRAPSYEHFQAGEGLQVIELNGVTSEATHIYDPKTRLRDAYRTLCEQWRTAFEIGAENRRRGVRPASVRDLVRRLGRYRRQAKSHPPAG